MTLQLMLDELDDIDRRFVDVTTWTWAGEPRSYRGLTERDYERFQDLRWRLERHLLLMKTDGRTDGRSNIRAHPCGV